MKMFQSLVSLNHKVSTVYSISTTMKMFEYFRKQKFGNRVEVKPFSIVELASTKKVD